MRRIGGIVAILIVLTCVVVWRRDRARMLYAAALLCGFIAFCGYLKWQPNFSRLLLPLFVLASPLAGIIEDAGKRGIVQLVLCLLLLDNARAPLLENWVRPLKGPNSVLRRPRDAQYFSDLGQWHNQESYLKTVEVLAQSKCETVGIDITHLQLEYPIEALLRERNPRVRFLHTGVENASSRYAAPVDAKPCAVVCLDCLGDTQRATLYAAFPQADTAGRFLTFHNK